MSAFRAPTLPRAENRRGRPKRIIHHPHRESAAQRAVRIEQRDSLAPSLADLVHLRPKTRAECHDARDRLTAHLPADDPYRVHRPCPFVSCRFHLHVDVSPDGAIVVVSTEDMPLDIAHTCALDVIDEHPEGVTREEMGTILRVSCERTRFYERRLEAKLLAHGGLEEWRDYDRVNGESALAQASER